MPAAESKILVWIPESVRSVGGVKCRNAVGARERGTLVGTYRVKSPPAGKKNYHNIKSFELRNIPSVDRCGFIISK